VDAAGWRRARNILCVRLDAIGDVLMTQPAMRAMRAAVPGRRLTLLTSTAGRAIAPLLPEIDDVIAHDPPWMKPAQSRPDPTPDAALIEALRERDFDAAVIFTVHSQSPLPAALLCHLAGIPLRAAHCRENPYGLLTDWLPDSDAAPGAAIRHEVRRQIDLVESLGALAKTDDRMRVRVSSEAKRAARVRLLRAGLDDAAPWALLHPGATAPSRRYPAPMFAAAASRLVRDHGWQVVVAGGRGDAQIVDELMAQMTSRAVHIDSGASIGELAALISLAPILIANNSAPMHIAAAVGTPVVALYALTNPQHTPWRVPARVLNHDVPCRNCLRSVCPFGDQLCLRAVPPDAVVSAALELFAETRRPADFSAVPRAALRGELDELPIAP